jgi:hypothetical protein
MLTQNLLKELLSYNCETGIFTWKQPFSRRVSIGDKAGCVTARRYVVVGVMGKLYLAHRLAWLYMYGYFPEKGIDHINRDTTDNRGVNLREVSQSCNTRNTGNNTKNSSGVKGVYFSKKQDKFGACIGDKGKTIHLGYHECLTEAACHRLAAEQCLDWAGCDSSSPAYKYVKEYTLCSF